MAIAWKAIQPRSQVSGHPLSAQALDWIQSRFTECKRKHSACGDAERIRLPRRLLTLTCKSDEIFVNLVEYSQARAERPRRGVYAALSHCWGDHRSCITTKHNLKDRLKGIPWNTIPRTFQEAIKLALQLKIDRIWIDSLCIVQDDVEDWNVESAKMAAIYRFAALTLAATGSSSDTHGCFLESSGRSQGVELSLPKGTFSHRIAVREAITHWESCDKQTMKDRFPLMTRGWAFQERLLSPRILHFCRSELVWECRELSVCECGGLADQTSPGGIYYCNVQAAEQEWQDENAPAEQTPSLRMGSVKNKVEGWRDKLNEVGLAGLASLNTSLHRRLDRRWQAKLNERQKCPGYVSDFHRIIEQYSKLQLTHISDRLPALSGLCKRVQHIRGPYVAGLWADSITFDLMWRVDRLNLSLTRDREPQSYRGPSWSWVAVDEPVTFWPDIVDFLERERNMHTAEDDTEAPPSYESQYVCLGRSRRRIDFKSTVAGKNRYGSVEPGASMEVTASAKAVKLLYVYHMGEDGEELDILHYKLSLEYMDWAILHSSSISKAVNEFELTFYADYPLGAPGPRHLPNGVVLKLLLIHPRISLVLHELEDESFVRVGIARMSDDAVNYYNIDWMQKSLVSTIVIR